MLFELIHNMLATFGLPLTCLLVGVLLISLLGWIWRPRNSWQGRGWQRRRSGQRVSRNQQQFLLQESAIEEQFRLAWSQAYPLIPLIPQYQIGRYRVDFAHIPSQIAIELDGFVAHSSTYQIENDCRRQREIMKQGWHVFRFGGREIHHDAGRCVQETYAFIQQELPPQSQDQPYVELPINIRHQSRGS